MALLELSSLHEAVVGPLNVELKKRLMVRVEVATRPDQLLLVDEHTSWTDRLDSILDINFLAISGCMQEFKYRGDCHLSLIEKGSPRETISINAPVAEFQVSTYLSHLPTPEAPISVTIIPSLG
ncbi:hypothetical protein B9Z19DRAFT_1126901 [Tuber borchii]|uniref:Uncharacterized protein n=1 Tax=Tuber borchii TaxID=42251 RepID=A0A2T6ZS81_TUBBO|nr:hypothetical protein B9Z19DRAFT_1126901 [Tuber borchii]